MSHTVHVIAVLTARPGERDAILAAFGENLPAVLAEKGCITYVPTVDHEGSTAPHGPDTIVVVEEWASYDDLEAHRVAPHMKTFGSRIADRLADRAVHILKAP